jgi:hypothetical protein
VSKRDCEKLTIELACFAFHLHGGGKKHKITTSNYKKFVLYSHIEIKIKEKYNNEKKLARFVY